MRKLFFPVLIFLVWSAVSRAGDIWAIHGVDAEGIVMTNPQVIQFTLYMDSHHTPVVTYVESSVEEQKKGKYDIYVGESHPDHNVRFGAYSYDWNSRQLTVTDPVEDSTRPAEYNKCVFAKIHVDSSYPGYSTKPLKDGSCVKKANFKAKERAWASAETHRDHWIEAAFDKPVTLQEVRLYWAWDKKKFHSSKDIHLFYLDGSGREVEIRDYKKTNDVIDKAYQTPESLFQQTQWTFPAVTTTELRILQTAGGGSAERPDLMWIAQVWAY